MSSKNSLEAEIGGKLSLRNFDTMYEKVELAARSLFPYAGRILSKRAELTNPAPEPPEDMEKGSSAEMIYQAKVKEYVHADRQYILQKDTIAIEIQRILDEELRRLMESDVAYNTAKDSDPADPIGMWKALHDKVASGVHFTVSHFLLQFKKIVNARMSDKESLATYRHHYAEELSKVDIMAKRLKMEDDDFKKNTVFMGLFAGFFLEGLNSRFDGLRKDVRSETMTTAKYPDNMVEAIQLAEKYDGLKGDVLTAKDSQNEIVGAAVAPSYSKRDSNTVAAATPAVNIKKNDKKKGKPHPKSVSFSTSSARSEPAGKKNDKGFYTDPHKPPPKPWVGMKYCSRHQRWCKHSSEDCTLDTEKVGLCFEDEETMTAWPGWDQM